MIGHLVLCKHRRRSLKTGPTSAYKLAPDSTLSTDTVVMSPWSRFRSRSRRGLKTNTKTRSLSLHSVNKATPVLLAIA